MRLTPPHRHPSPMMNPINRISLLLLGLAPQVPGEVDFAHQVAPVSARHCAECHMEAAKKGGFSMNTRESLMAGSEDGPVVEPGKSAAEPVDGGDPLRRQIRPHAAERTARSRRIRWKSCGNGSTAACTGNRASPSARRLTNHHSSRAIRICRRWSMAARIRWTASSTRISPSTRSPAPAPIGDAAFIRRLTLDLTGLLPDPAEVDAFVNDTAPDKRDKLIAAVLARDTDYAEHWLSFWNDLLRNDYAGTGYIDGGRKQITAWLYQALLSNKPYDQFVRELIAPPDKQSSGFINGIQWRGSVNASQTRRGAVLAIDLADLPRHQHEVRVVPRQLRRPLEARRRLRPRGDFRRRSRSKSRAATNRPAKWPKPAWIFPELGEDRPGGAARRTPETTRRTDDASRQRPFHAAPSSTACGTA